MEDVANATVATISSAPTYAERVASKSRPKTTGTSKPAIIVTSSDPTSTSHETLDKLRKTVTFRNSSYAPHRILPSIEGKIRIEFDDPKQQEETLGRIREFPEFRAEPVKKSLPMIILKGIHRDVPSCELIDIIVNQNPSLKEHIVSESDIALCFLKNNRRPDLYNAVLRLKPAAWHAAMALERLCVDYQKIHLEEFSPFRQCYKCLQFGHTMAKCDFEGVVCSRCSAGTHKFADCPFKYDENKVACINCVLHNKKFRLSAPIAHCATSNQCPRIVAVKERIAANTNYG
ncbi:hypothetical protein NE865_05987 [Phthorimaea operculella]|nr:hypothetical protein NE865_05987 [Phthorimaea operculella]